VDGAVAPTDQRKAPGARRAARPRQALRALPWIAPALTALALVFVYGIYRLVREALHRKDEYVGLENIRIALDDPLFQTSIGHNLRLLLALPVMVVLALVLSILLFEGLRGWRAHRFFLFLPYILPIPVVGLVFVQILTFNGALNTALRGAGLDGLAQDWLGSTSYALWSVAAVIVWKELGFGIILFLARLLSLPADVFEAAQVDGAGFWRTHLRITLPLLLPIISFYVVIEAITLLSWVFNYVYVMTSGGPGDATQVAETYIYQTATTFNAPFLAASAAVVLLGGVAVGMVIFSAVRIRANRASEVL
jgi:ABC-type sugar transport system permease subunit